MKKIIVCVLLIVSTLCSTVYAMDAEVFIDGSSVYFDYSTGFPYYQFMGYGELMVPIKAVSDAWGAEYTFEEDTNTVIICKDSTVVRAVIGEKYIYRNNVKIPNTAAAEMSNGVIYLPIERVFESFGAEVTSAFGALKIETCDESGFINMVENTPSVTNNYWGIWNDALVFKGWRDYSSAVDRILSISSVFLSTNSDASCAILYKHLGECYSHLGDYTKARMCFEKEAEYWSNVSDMEECCKDAKRRADLIKTDTKIYVKTTDPTLDAKSYFGVEYEPEHSVFLGAYAEGDTNIYNPYDSNKFYMKTFPKLVGEDMAGYHIYLPYGKYVSHYSSHIKRAIKEDKIMQVSLEPHNGLWEINGTDGYIKALAKEMEKSKCKFIIRFAGEMNDPYSSWYSADPGVYIEKFRLFADIFHQYAPSVPVIWAPNFYPEETIDDYYPGDDYVDYVGMSSYQSHQPVTDPMDEGVDRRRWSSQLDRIYSLYGHKKPIIIVEGGCSYVDYDTGADITAFASRQIKDFYTYLPIKYPNVKMSFIFSSNEPKRKFMLSGNKTYLDAYKEGISSSLYSPKDKNYGYSYYELGNNVRVKAEPTELYGYITTPENDIAYVVYYINGVRLGVSYGIPYKVNVDFSSFKGQNVNVTAKAFNSNHRPVTNYTVEVEVV